jgi:molecular chaperone GrpE (heat shock protein)
MQPVMEDANGQTSVSPQVQPYDEIRTQLNSVCAALEKLIGVTEREHERAAFRERVIDDLHAENVRLRRGELDMLLEPVRSGLMRVHDLASRAAVQSRSSGELDPGRGAALLDAVADEAADALVTVGMERYEAVVGEVYDAGRHRPVGAVEVANLAQDNTVVQVRSAGFARPDKVVRRADVVVGRYLALPPDDPAVPTDLVPQQRVDDQEEQR